MNGQKKSADKEQSPLEQNHAKLILRLFSKAHLLLHQIIESEKKNFEQTNAFDKSLHSQQIILSLRFVLDLETKDPISKNLYDTYTAMAVNLVRARERKDIVAIKEVHEVLGILKEAWATLLEDKYGLSL